MALASRNTTLLLVVLSILILAGGGYFAYDQYNVLMRKADEVTQLEDAKKIQEKKVQDLENLIAAYEEVKPKVQKVNEVLPTEESVPELIYQLEAIATKEAGVFFGGANFSKTAEEEGGTPTQPKKEEAVKQMSISVNITGTYEGLKRYLEAVQTNIRILDITSISFQASPIEGLEGGEDIYEYTVGMMAYYVD